MTPNISGLLLPPVIVAADGVAKMPAAAAAAAEAVSDVDGEQMVTSSESDMEFFR